MEPDALVDIKNALLKHYADNSLQHAGLGVGVAVVFVTEVNFRANLPMLFGHFSTFYSFLAPTMIFGLFMFIRSAFWGRMSYVLVAESKPVSNYQKTEDPMKDMYFDHKETMRKTHKMLTRAGDASYFWILIFCVVSVVSGFVA